MANTAQGIKGIMSGIANFQSRPQSSIGETSPLHGPPSYEQLGERGAANGLHPAESELQSLQATRGALHILDDCPTDPYALQVFWAENHLAFESQMLRYLNAPDNPALSRRILYGVVSLSRFYCNEIDDPKAWVARCANLETRRVALQLAR
jgi:hypothetical protein